MKKSKIIVDIILIGILIVIIVLQVFDHNLDSYRGGYMQGRWDTAMYHKENQYYPSMGWTEERLFELKNNPDYYRINYSENCFDEN